MRDAEAFWNRLFAMSIDEMNEAERQYFAVNWFLCEWANGFLSQYFCNSGGEQVAALELALTEMGADEAVAIVREARQVVFDGSEVGHENLPWPLPESKHAQLRTLDLRISVEENAIWDRLEAFALSRGLYGRAH